MPNDIVDAMHRLAASSKQAGGITITNKHAKIITDNDDEEDENATDDEPIPVINNDNVEYTSFIREEMGNEESDQAITRVENKKI